MIANLVVFQLFVLAAVNAAPELRRRLRPSTELRHSLRCAAPSKAAPPALVTVKPVDSDDQPQPPQVAQPVFGVYVTLLKSSLGSVTYHYVRIQPLSSESGATCVLA